jgi:hypothetical protein
VGELHGATLPPSVHFGYEVHGSEPSSVHFGYEVHGDGALLGVDVVEGRGRPPVRWRDRCSSGHWPPS